MHVWPPLCIHRREGGMRCERMDPCAGAGAAGQTVEGRDDHRAGGDALGVEGGGGGAGHEAQLHSRFDVSLEPVGILDVGEAGLFLSGLLLGGLFFRLGGGTRATLSFKLKPASTV